LARWQEGSSLRARSSAGSYLVAYLGQNMSRRARFCAVALAIVLSGCGGGSSKSSHGAATDSGLTRLRAVCRQAQGELLGIYERNIEHGPSTHEIEGTLARGGRAELAAIVRRRMGHASRQSGAVLSATSTRIGALSLAKPDEDEARAALRNLAEHRSLLVEFEHEIHRFTNPAEIGGWISLYAERAQGCGPRGGK
jgi:hypothetical protein